MFKYLILEDLHGLPRVIIFDCIIDHLVIKNRMPDNWKLISAGKISFNFGKKEWSCQSGSVTLEIKTNKKQTEEDLETIKKISEIY